MPCSAEVRWFWREEPKALASWFRDGRLHGCAPGGGGERTDRYLLQGEAVDLGIKARGGGDAEVKALVDVVADASLAAPFQSAVEVWVKRTATGLRLDQLPCFDVRKRRWLRKLDASGPAVREVALGPDELPLRGAGRPESGCNVEWTHVLLPDGARWWTLGFEAFGPPADVARILRASTATMSERTPPPLAGATVASYPAWLAVVAGDARP